MAQALTMALDIVERIESARTINAACRSFLHALEPFGAKSLIVHDRRIKALDRQLPLCSIQPAGWVGSEESRFVERHNPNPAAGLRLGRPFLWREAKQPTAKLDGAYWEALGTRGGENGLCVPVFDRRNYLAGVSMAFGRREIDMLEQRAVTLSTYALIERIAHLGSRPKAPPKLSTRERDCLGFVAEGKTDWEISVILGVSRSTVHSYVEAAKTKLGAHTRAQAVAIAATQSVI